MTLRNPGFLYLALLLIVPLVLYLLPMPRRRIAASAVYLWERFLKSEPFGRASDRLRRAIGFTLLVTILACLILAAVDLAVGGSGIDASKVVVLVDASASMNATRDGATNLDRAKIAAANLIDSLSGGAEVAVIEAAGRMTVLRPLVAVDADASRTVRAIEPFDGPTDLPSAMAEAYRVFGADPRTKLYVFTDAPLPPEGPWADRANAWVAPPAGENIAVTTISATRRGKTQTVRFTLANFGRTARTISGTIWLGNRPVRSFDDVSLAAGQSAEQSASFDGTGAASIVEVRLDPPEGDALAADNVASIVVPPADSQAVAVVAPTEQKPNAYVSAMLATLVDEGIVTLATPDAASPPLTVYVNHSPDVWPKGGAIVLYPLRTGVVKVSGLANEPVTVTRQVRHPLLRGVDLRGLSVKGAVRTELPDWAEPIVFADDMPVVWAGSTGKIIGTAAQPEILPPTPLREQKVLLVGIPLSPAGSRLPLAAAFPVLMRNAANWMLPEPEALRPGERIGDWTRRRTGLDRRPGDPMAHAFSVLSAVESDLRRSEAGEPPEYTARTPLAGFLVALAAVLLVTEWALFHKRLTE